MNTIFPETGIAQNFIKEVIEPTLTKMSNDVSRRIIIDCYIVHGEERLPILPKLEVGKNECQIMTGEIKLRFRMAFGARILMRAEAVFDREHTVANCSGFLLKAEKELMTFRRTAFTVRYSAWDHV